MKRLVAGPWVGELGWELCSWQGYIRKLSHKYDTVIVSTFEGHEALYTDFTTNFINHNLRGIKDCWAIRADGSSILPKLRAQLKTFGGDWIQPSRYIPVKEQVFIKYGNAERAKRRGHVFDLVLHARKPIGNRPEISWPQKNWNKVADLLLKKGLKIAAIGTEAYLPEGVTDFRNNNLSDDMDLLSAARMAAGPASGPMHLASLCGTSNLVWCDNKQYSVIGNYTNDVRYKLLWNPLRVSCLVRSDLGWQPSAYQVYDAISEGLNIWPAK